MGLDRNEIVRMHRNMILSSLSTVRPSVLLYHQLFRTMISCYPGYTANQFINDATYLEEKEYIVRLHPRTAQETPRRTVGESCWRLTAKGDEIVNDLIDDPALEV